MGRNQARSAGGERGRDEIPVGHKAIRLLRDLLGLSDPTEVQGRIRLHTLSLTRWVAVVGQLFTVLFVHYSLGIALPIEWLIPGIAVSAAINLFLMFTLHAATRLSERSALLLFGFDILQLGYLLALTGGLRNPFAALVAVPLMLGAATLGLRSTVLLSLLAVATLTGLSFVPTALPWFEHGLAFPGLYVAAVWTALTMASILLAAYAWRVAEETRRMTDALGAAQMALAREQEMSALGALATAAAHELGSPLATILITAREMLNELEEDDPLRAETQVLLDQTLRCRTILAGIGRRRDHDEHAPFVRAPLSSVLREIADIYARPAVTLEVSCRIADGLGEPMLVPTPELRHALGNLLNNGLGFAKSRLEVRVEHDYNEVRVVLHDDGPGFAPEVLEWLGEPYLSTRRDHGGLGLGVFIATTLLARTGAALHVENASDGAVVTIRWSSEAWRRSFGENVG
ncbi:MAG TPA: ActS/PrrB/RegB family redox-sensitive histidine kinase [Geminicoccus sp.]|jgi:two-component system sensor histidine kinase RegB|uniref:ActS/PrrB/RegB family redox-sensitive histidine kinase n=1 Tax=Geminicoccus sp. TaxID=2024832 RepID=UPI002E2F34E9|nr:ActS/PrrB/RegB family redox-sensitive histidine kinase [Geminicoccus sp.]HEX2525983.1 ActS/PrrB/RegB family redox-sensitive histidine kinase [Geminicoccus sp.]